MFTLLARLFLKNRAQADEQALRRGYGMLSGILGIVLNVLLFLFKYIAGMQSGSIAVTGDAFNNLSDAGSSFITLLGFRLANRKPDADHPFGHGRIEYISGFIVSAAIILMGFELGKSSIDKILHPEPVETGVLSVVILLVSIGVKLYMCFYNRRIGARINSTAMRATAADSLSDAAATTIVLLSILVMRWTNVRIDGWCGVAVACFILYAGYGAARETLSPLLGNPPDPEFVARLREIVLSHEEILGMHDLIVHDYGPGRIMASLHGEVDGKGDIFALHDKIDQIEQELGEKLGCEAVIHMDPVETDNEEVTTLRRETEAIAKEIDPSFSIHDFRVAIKPSGHSLIFDLVIPIGYPAPDSEIVAQITARIRDAHPSYRTSIKVDKSAVI